MLLPLPLSPTPFPSRCRGYGPKGLGTPLAGAGARRQGRGVRAGVFEPPGAGRSASLAPASRRHPTAGSPTGAVPVPAGLYLLHRLCANRDRCSRKHGSLQGIPAPSDIACLPATGNGQRATGNGQRATGNGQRATGNGQYRRLTCSSQIPFSAINSSMTLKSTRIIANSRWVPTPVQ